MINGPKLFMKVDKDQISAWGVHALQDQELYLVFLP